MSDLKVLTWSLLSACAFGLAACNDSSSSRDGGSPASPDENGAAPDAEPPQGTGSDSSGVATGGGNSTGGTASTAGAKSNGAASTGGASTGGASAHGGTHGDADTGASGADDTSPGDDGTSHTSGGTSTGGGSATGGTGGTGGTHATGAGGTHSSGGSGGIATGGMGAMAGDSSQHSSGGMAGMPGMTGGTGGDMGMTGGTGGDMGMGDMGGAGDDMPGHDHCMDGEYADARDALLATPSAPDHFVASNGDIDLPVPQAVLDWMDEREWKPTHDAWHNIRRCRGSTGGGEGSASSSATMCAYTELVPAHQECADAQNGFEFLVMHRHMMIALRQAFPAHADLFAGFPHFPFTAKDVPAEWQSRFGSGWTSDIVQTAKTLEDIEHHLDQFPTDGDLGKFIQCGMMSSGASSIHGAMHFKWVVNESPNSLGKQAVNIGNYMFWKLHGWIDGIWERYRVAKGLTDDDPTLTSALVEQCREMHALGRVINPDLVEDNTDPLPVEHGYFHENVRPALDRVCSGCHSESSPEANMSLGGHISSADVVKNLVNVKTFDGGQFYRVVPGEPDQSWLYLKAAALAADAGCIGSTCNTQPMPPGATPDERLTSDELAALRQWILDGAQAPTP